MSMTEEEIQKLIELHKAGTPIQKIAEEFGVSLVTIKRRIAEIRKTHDLPWRSKSKQKTNMEIEQRQIDATPWNLTLARQYITREWRM